MNKVLDWGVIITGPLSFVLGLLHIGIIPTPLAGKLQNVFYPCMLTFCVIGMVRGIRRLTR
jgi:hypothetical protein